MVAGEGNGTGDISFGCEGTTIVSIREKGRANKETGSAVVAKEKAPLAGKKSYSRAKKRSWQNLEEVSASIRGNPRTLPLTSAKSEVLFAGGGTLSTASKDGKNGANWEMKRRKRSPSQLGPGGWGAKSKGSSVGGGAARTRSSSI